MFPLEAALQTAPLRVPLIRVCCSLRRFPILCRTTESLKLSAAERDTALKILLQNNLKPLSVFNAESGFLYEL